LSSGYKSVQRASSSNEESHRRKKVKKHLEAAKNSVCGGLVLVYEALSY
jgi:hypothetical protein